MCGCGCMAICGLLGGLERQSSAGNISPEYIAYRWYGAPVPAELRRLAHCGCDLRRGIPPDESRSGPRFQPDLGGCLYKEKSDSDAGGDQRVRLG